MEYLTGQAAVTAFKHDHPTATEGPLDDHYIVNPTKDHVVLTLAPNAIVKLLHVNGTDHTIPIAVPQSTLSTYPAIGVRVFWITVSGTTVIEIDEQFTP